MCGIVGAVATRNIVPILVQGLQRLEYRGYDSCGIAVNTAGVAPPPVRLRRVRGISRVADLAAQAAEQGVEGHIGIAHTRWATHGAPAVSNAHPHFSMGAHGGELAGDAADDARGRVTLVHNGIIENHETLRRELEARGYHFTSQTDTEVIVHLIDSLYDGDLFEAVQAAARQLHGSFAIAVLHRDEPQRLVGARQGSPLVLERWGRWQGHFLASDAAGPGRHDRPDRLSGRRRRGRRAAGQALDRGRRRPARATRREDRAGGQRRGELGPYRHYMQKEIFEQPRAVADTLEGVLSVAPELFEAAGNHAPGEGAHATFGAVDQVLILACGTSYYAGCVAKYWLEAVARIPTQVEIASEYRYRASVANPRTLVVTISQSGETADTLAALRHAQELGMRHTLTVCNVPTSAMVRECRLAYLTRAGTEIGVASTKAFTTQLVGLFLLTLALAQARELLPEAAEANFINQLRHLPAALQAVLALEPQVIGWAEQFASKENALFLGRGLHYPIALEGALKLKEITYIHAEGYPAGEMKHGPIALLDETTPVVCVATDSPVLEKVLSNVAEVRARGADVIAIATEGSDIVAESADQTLFVPRTDWILQPILAVIPLQLLAYHTARMLGLNVDQPRNLAKTVTVE